MMKVRDRSSIELYRAICHMKKYISTDIAFLAFNIMDRLLSYHETNARYHLKKFITKLFARTVLWVSFKFLDIRDFPYSLMFSDFGCDCKVVYRLETLILLMLNYRLNAP